MSRGILPTELEKLISALKLDLYFLSFSLVGFAVTARVDEHQHLSRIFISDVLPDGLAYGEGPHSTRCLCSLLIQSYGMQSAQGNVFLQLCQEVVCARIKNKLNSLIENAYA